MKKMKQINEKKTNKYKREQIVYFPFQSFMLQVIFYIASYMIASSVICQRFLKPINYIIKIMFIFFSQT